jgi:hypothetical protein
MDATTKKTYLCCRVVFEKYYGNVMFNNTSCNPSVAIKFYKNSCSAISHQSLTEDSRAAQINVSIRWFWECGFLAIEALQYNFPGELIARQLDAARR